MIKDSVTAIAIVGVGLRIPGARSAAEFWRLLCSGHEATQEFSVEQLAEAGLPRNVVSNPSYVRTRGVIDDVDLFAADFFKCTPREAEILDPQHRIFLEIAHECLNDAAVDPSRFSGRIGVYASSGLSSYFLRNLLPNQELVATTGEWQLVLANDKDQMPTRVSYLLGLTGPSVAVQTACSSSLTAVQMACDSLILRHCDLCLAGGVSIDIPQMKGYLYEEGGKFSIDGKTRSFDAKGGGMVPSSGAGCVLLQRLGDAISQNSQIYGVILGSAINNDGSNKIGFTAPSETAQFAVVSSAWKVAGLSPAQASFFEGHGTGTRIGDAIEVAALTRVFQQSQFSPRSCALGSVKSNVGHLDCAAGVVGLIKTALSLKHRTVVPTINVQQVLPEINRPESPFYLPLSTTKLNVAGPVYGGVSSFGIGGTNVHLVLGMDDSLGSQCDVSTEREDSGFIVPLSAESAPQVAEFSGRLLDHLSGNHISLKDISFSLGTGRIEMKARAAFVVQSYSDLYSELEALKAGQTSAIAVGEMAPQIVFMFPGAGALHRGVLADFREDSYVQADVDACLTDVAPELSRRVRDILWGTGEAQSLETDTASLLSIFITDYVIARMLKRVAIEPVACVGHSLGEYAAAVISGVLTLRDAVSLVVARGDLFSRLPNGGMISIDMSLERLRQFEPHGLDVAVVNHEGNIVLSGLEEPLVALEQRLEESDISYRRLHVTKPAHSRFIDEILPQFNNFTGSVKSSPPSVPLVSNVFGGRADEQFADPGYWGKHLRSTVHFGAGVSEILKTFPRALLLEVGPGTALGLLISSSAIIPKWRVISTMPHPASKTSSRRAFLSALAGLWKAGCTFAWSNVPGLQGGERVSLPATPLKRERYWVAPRQVLSGDSQSQEEKVSEKPARLYQPQWRRMTNESELDKSVPTKVIYLATEEDAVELPPKLIEEQVIVLRRSGNFRKLGQFLYEMDPLQREHWKSIFDEVLKEAREPVRIAFLRLRSVPEPVALDYFSHEPLGFLQGILGCSEAEKSPKVAQLFLITKHLACLEEREDVNPFASMQVGMVRAFNRESDSIRATVLDIGSDERTGLSARLNGLSTLDLHARTLSGVCAVRQSALWLLEAVTVAPNVMEAESSWRCHEDTVIITGGLGGIGFEIARHIIDTTACRVMLIARRTKVDPARDDSILRDKLEWVAQHRDRVDLYEADVADQGALLDLAKHLRTAERKIHAVLHCAGESPGGSLLAQQKNTLEKIFNAKVSGTVNLLNCFAGLTSKFILFSSITAIGAEFGSADHSASNCFLDAVAHSRAFGLGTIVSVNWPAWQEVGQAATAASQLGLEKWRREETARGVTVAEGLRVIDLLLDSQGSPSQLIVMKEPIEDFLARTSRALSELSSEFAHGQDSQFLKPRPKVSTLYEAPSSRAEQEVVEIFGSLLGFQGIGINDNFFELGGHSLLASILLTRIRETFSSKISMKDLLSGPTVKDLAGRLPNDIVARSERQQAVKGDSDKRFESFPLTDIQAAYWVGRHAMLSDVAVPSHGYAEVDCVGLDVGRLEVALNKVIQQHDMLRMQVDSQGRQSVQPFLGSYRIHARDLTNMGEEARLHELARLRDELSHQIFDPSKWPLFHVSATLIGADRMRLHFGFDLLIADGTSLQILISDLKKCYENVNAVLPALNYSFRDFVSATLSYAYLERIEDAKQYWVAKVDTMPGAPILPASSQRGKISKVRFLRHRRRLPELEWNCFQKQCESQHITPTAAICALFAITLHRWSESDAFTLNLTAYNREPFHPDVAQLVGDFTTNIFLGLTIDSTRSIMEIARRVSGELLEAFHHRAYSGIRFLREFGPRLPDRGINGMPIVFTSMLTQKSGLEESALWSWLGEVVFTISQTPQVWLDHQIFEDGDELVTQWDVLEGIFPDGLIEQMLECFFGCLVKLSNGSVTWDAPVRGLFASVTAGTVDPLPAVSFSARPLLHDGFLQTARRSGDLPYLRMSDKTVSYGELLCWASAIAQALTQAGCRRGDPIAVVAPRSEHQVAALLGVLIFGSPYVPIEPALPTARKNQVFRQIGAQVVISTVGCATELVGDWGGRLILADEYRQGISPGAVGAGAADISAEHSAYIIFTSGTTGQPKGVEVSHGAAVNTILDLGRKFSLNEEDTFFQASSYGFDLSVFDIFASALVGADLIIPKGAEIETPETWIDLARRFGCTVWNSVPSLMELVTATCEDSHQVLSGLRLVMLSGDWIPVRLPERIRTISPKASIVSLGGATEAAIWSVYYPISKVDENWTSIPYGRALANQTIEVLDEHLDPCPIWRQGEIFIGGDGLAKGYYGDKARSEQSFIWHPTTKRRLYRTGDLGRYLSDGDIEILGRKDRQVKINGFRVELAEIETVFESHPNVERAVAAVRGERFESKQICVFVKFRTNVSTPAEELTEFAVGLLPSYMVPQVIEPVPFLPLTANGKIDRGALLGRVQARSSSSAVEGGKEEASSKLRAKIGDLWRAVLGLSSDASIENTSFFAQGGDSIRAIRLVSKLHGRGARITVRDIFEHQTFERIVQYLAPQNIDFSEEGRDVAEKPAPSRRYAPSQRKPYGEPNAAVRRDGRGLAAEIYRDFGLGFKLEDIEEVLPLSPLQEGMFIDSLLSQTTGAYIGQTLYELDFEVDIGAFNHAVFTAVKERDVLRCSYVSDMGKPLQVLLSADSAMVGIREVQFQSGVPLREQLEDIMIKDRKAAFDLAVPPLLRFLVVKHKTSSFLLVTMHHIIMDAWSSAIFLRDVLSRYFSSAKSELPTVLPPQYRLYLDWLRTSKSEPDVFQTERLFRFECGPTPPPGLKVSCIPLSRIEANSIVGITLSAAATRGVKIFAAQAGCAEMPVYLTAFAIALGIVKRTQNILVGVTFSGRPPDLSGVEDIVGLFINSLPCGFVFDDTEFFVEAVKATNAKVLELSEFQHLPLATIKKLSGLEGKKRLFEMLFVYESIGDMGELFAQGIGSRGRQIESRIQNSLPFTFRITPLKEETRVEALFDPALCSGDAVNDFMCLYMKVMERFCDATSWESTSVADLRTR